ncbi:hypothetical protein Rhe02_47280 [Rhizocola hellebori]|uniref:DUF7779 domain-containing protein n=1 Tax=Rhizocola hellebori TaxID=1392758 RepID=A0A8J3QA04_9ACTN|nr:FxSxx-COOH system tetratricopeptide repeat protein [Rhizocola hellebori]GIH06661.1 hypothetical protein Rhe02_47280 [Rhizocola hellebori]
MKAGKSFRLKLGALIWAGATAIVSTASALAVNAASDVGRENWPTALLTLRDHPFRWAAALTAATVLVALLWTWWQARQELADDTTGIDTSAPGPLLGDHARVITSQQIDKVVMGNEIHHHERAAVVLPSRVTNLPPRNPDFTGRANLLDELKSGLAAGPVAVTAMHGLGGIGKSQLALEFAHQALARSTYRVAWWIRAESALTLTEDLTSLGPGLGVPVVADQEQMTTAVYAVLQDRADWLLVFDNAPNAEAVRKSIPPGRGHVVITSRSRQWAGLGNPVGVTEFLRGESVAFLAHGTGETGPQLDELAELLGDLPLALAQAVAYMRRAGGLSTTAYLNLFRDRQQAGRLLAAGAGDGYPDSVATTWLIHFQWLAAHQPAAAELLQLCAFLDPDEINLDVLLSQPDLLADELTANLAEADELQRIEAVTALVEASLLSRLDDEHVRVHRLVSFVTRHQLSAHDQDHAAWAQHTINLLAKLMPDQPWEPPTWPVCAQLAPHITIAADHAPNDPNTAIALAQLGLYLQVRAEFVNAKTVLARALAIKKAVHGEDHPEVAIAMTNLGIVEQQLGDSAAAKVTFTRALAIKEAVYGPDDPNVAITLTNLGIVERQLGNLAAAKAALTRALAIKEAVHGEDRPQVAITLTNLGNVERQLGNLAAAKAALTRALAIDEKAHGVNHPNVAITLTNLGIVERQLGNLAAAKAALTRALAIKEAVHGEDHLEVAITLTNLGNVERQLGNLAAAKAALTRALAIKEAVFGPDHPNVATTLTSLGIVEQQLGGTSRRTL